MRPPSREQLGGIRYHKQRLHGTEVSPPLAATSEPAPTTLKKVLPSPNNTPASRIKKTKKMAKQRTQRPEKRHLVRWTEEMDKKLLLAMQYQCNFAGLAVPWTEIGAIMGEGITGGAVIQHLAKLRIRMVNQNLPVPPPLRRGGAGSRISTCASSAPKAKATPTKNGSAQATANSTKLNSVKAKKSGKRAAPGSDESEEDEDSWNNDESDAEYGKPHAKRAKSHAKARTSRNIKKEDSDEEVTTPFKAPKRKHDDSPVGDDSDVEDDDQNGLVAAGAPWLTLEDDYVGHPKTGKKTPYKKKSLIVSLRISPHKTDSIFKNEDSDDDDSEEEVIDGEVESFVDGSHVLSNEELNHGFSNPSYNQSSEGFAAAQLEPASDLNDDNGMYNNSYHAGSQAMPFNGGLYSNRQTFVNDFDSQYNNLSAFQASDSIFENDGLVHSQAMTGVDNGNGGNFDLDQLDNQSTGLFGDVKGEFNNHGVANTDSFGNNGLLNGIGQQDDFSYQTDNGHTASFNSFGNNAGGLPLLNGNNHIQSVPYPLQTSWPSNSFSISNQTSVNQTSVNQTPAGTSAGADAGTGYFGDEDYSLGSFNNANIDYSANDGSNMFDVGDFDGNFVDGGLYGNDF